MYLQSDQLCPIQIGIGGEDGAAGPQLTYGEAEALLRALARLLDTADKSAGGGRREKDEIRGIVMSLP